MRFKVQLQRREDTELPSGQISHSYEQFAEVWADISALTAREFFAASQVQSEITTKITIRWRDDIDPTCRVSHIVSYASPMIVDTYDVVAPLPDQKTGRRELVLLCKKNPAEKR